MARQQIANSQTNSFTGGMNLDIDKGLLKGDTYRYAENVRLTTNEGGTTGSLTNIEGLKATINQYFALKYVSRVEVILATATARDMAVVFTVDNTNNNRIYRLEFDDDGELLKEPTNVLRSEGLDLGLIVGGQISIVTRYESIDTIKVYWADGINMLRSINIASAYDKKNASLLSESAFDILTDSSLISPRVIDISTGVLPSGNIQYFYQLISTSSGESSLSGASNVISLLKSGEVSHSSETIGLGIGVDGLGLKTNKAVSINIDILFPGIYKIIKVYSVYYYNYASAPIVKLIADIDIPLEATKINVVDSGSLELDTISVQEFNSISNFSVVPKFIESKDNFMFVANSKIKSINENTYNYDTRAYQFDSMGQCLLDIGNGTGFVKYPKSAVINFESNSPILIGGIYDKIRYSDVEYRYRADGIHLGGEGKNVSYEFVNTYFIESNFNYWNAPATIDQYGSEVLSKTDEYIDRRTARIGDISSRSISKLRTNGSKSGLGYVDLDSLNISNNTGALNYSNVHLSNRLKSYQRDEIYRFGAVFLNKKRQRSEVSWIADIRIPANYVAQDNSIANEWDSSIFEAPSEIVDSTGVYSTKDDTTYDLSNQELLVKPLGIKFYFENVPPGVVAIEIVRCKRDVNNKTIFAQGALQKVGTQRDNGATATGTKDTLRPHPIMSMAYSYSIASPFVYFNGDSNYNPVYLNSEYRTTTDGGENGSLSYGYARQQYADGLPDIPGMAHASGAGLDGSLLAYDIHSAPFFYNRHYLFVASPETSFYGLDFAKSLSTTLVAGALDTVGIVHPISTPSLLKTSNSYTRYRGSDGLDRLNVLLEKGVNAPYTYPARGLSAIYLGADINKKNKASSDYNCTNGLSGVSPWHSFGLGTGSSTYIMHQNAVTSSFSDIYNDVAIPAPPGNYPYFSDLGVRVYISLGGYFLRTDSNSRGKFNNSIRNSFDNLEYPAILEDPDCSEGRNEVIFKYFCDFKHLQTSLSGNRAGGESIGLTYQNSDTYSDITTHTITNLDTPGNSIHLTKNINSLVYSGDIAAGINVDSATEYVAIGDSSYLNFSKSLTYGESSITNNYARNALAKTKISGIHGDGIVLSFADNIQVPSIYGIGKKRKKYIKATEPTEDKLTDDYASVGLSTYIVNLKQMSASLYGGFSANERQYSEYITTGYVMNVGETNRTTEGLVFGGDTFIGIFDYSVTRISDPMIVSTDRLSGSAAIAACQSKYVGAMFPLESSINLHIPSSHGYLNSGPNALIQKEPGVYAPAASLGESSSVTQIAPQYSYNSAYSSENSVIGYFSRLNTIKDDIDYDCRINVSSIKTNNERFDKWITFKPADYLDVDTQYGTITGLRKFNNRLFFWQQNAFGVAGTNEATALAASNISELTIGTGKLLGRYDYISTEYGFKTDVIGGIMGTPSALYWYDHMRAELCSYSGGEVIHSLSKEKGIQSILNTSKALISDKIPMIYDHKYNELIFTLNGLKPANTII